MPKSSDSLAIADVIKGIRIVGSVAFERYTREIDAKTTRIRRQFFPRLSASELVISHIQDIFRTRLLCNCDEVCRCLGKPWCSSPSATADEGFASQLAKIEVHSTEACADPGIEVFPGMSPVSHDLIKNRPRRTEIRRGPSAPLSHRFCRKTLATEISLVEWHLCRARLRFVRLT